MPMQSKKEWVIDVLEQCARYGYRTTPVFENGKAQPFGAGQDYKNLEAYRGCAHIGLVLDDLILVDYDGNKTDGIMRVAELELALDVLFMPEPAQVKGDSIHWLFKRDPDGAFKASADGYWLGVDIKTGNQLMHIKQGKELALVGREDIEEAPKVLLDALKPSDGVTISYGVVLGQTDLGDFEGLISHSNSNMSREDLEARLSKLDNNMPNSEWVKIGQALHDWDPVQGLELWEAWSVGGHTYKEGETAKRWASFRQGKGVTLGTLMHKVKEADYEDAKKELTAFIAQIMTATERDIEISIAPKIAKVDLTDIDREVLVKRIQDRYKALTDVRPSVTIIRDMITPKQVFKGELVNDDERPKWCKQWVYVNAQSGYVRLDDLVVRKAEAFNLECGRYVPMNENGNKISASKFVSDGGFIESVVSMAYMPTCVDRFCEFNGKRVLNTFDARTLPKPASNYTDEGLQAIETVKKHISFICNNNEQYSKILTEWLAHNVQFKGVKILWSPVIQSIEGIGKSWFGELLERCIGQENVGTVAPTQATSDFNGWATGVCVNILNELRVKGHNRYDAVNALKPLITDSVIQINDKGVKQYKTANTTNYICFTNYKDAIPIDSDSRRWWVIFVEIDTLDDVIHKTGDDHRTYFAKIFDAIRQYPDQILKWLLEYPISKEFLALKQAPATEFKDMMVSTESASHHFKDEVRELIERGGEFFNKEVVSSSDLFEALRRECFDDDQELPKPTQRNQILKALGYMQLPNLIKVKGKPRRIWAKKFMDNDKVRELLENPLADDFPF
jgi:hypothetical protein